MVHRDNSEGKKNKPRGRPFTKGHKRGKPQDDVLATSRHESGHEGGIVVPNPQSVVLEKKKDEQTSENVLSQLPSLVMETIDQNIKDSMNTPQEEEVTPVKEESKDLELIDSLEFKNGENTLTIRFSKKHNRMFRIQVFLNDKSEIRPVTYTGASTGYAFWNLLKGALNK